MTKRWLIAGFAAVTTLGSFAFVRAQGEGQAPDEASAQTAAADPTAQPIQFPHNIHAGQYQIDCQYCHFSAERSVDAGIPPVAACMGCHNVIPGQNNPEEVQKVRDFFSAGEAIPWVRIYKVADHVHFPHMRHVNAGVTCQTCHGEVQEMGVIEEVNQPLAMGWCVRCHVKMDARRDCTVCHY